jgi:hypothetical protein
MLYVHLRNLRLVSSATLHLSRIELQGARVSTFSYIPSTLRLYKSIFALFGSMCLPFSPESPRCDVAVATRADKCTR